MDETRRICECFDRGCPVHGREECGKEATCILYRIDMIDETGTAFCDDCADDAMDSGLYESRDDEEPEENDSE